MRLSTRIEVGVDSFLFFEVLPAPFSGFLRVQDVGQPWRQPRGSVLASNANYINVSKQSRVWSKPK